MANTQVEETAGADQATRRVPLAKLVPLIVVVIVVAGAFAAASRPSFGSRKTTDTSVEVVIGDAKSVERTRLPIALNEGSDPSHEVDHVIEPLKGIEGVSTATLDWSSGLSLTIAHDPAVISAEELSNLISGAGYLGTSPEKP